MGNGQASPHPSHIPTLSLTRPTLHMPTQQPLAALPIAPRVISIPAVNQIYHPYIVVQRMSNDLVVYSHDIGHIITVA